MEHRPCAKWVESASARLIRESGGGAGSGAEERIELRVKARRASDAVLTPEAQLAGAVASLHHQQHLAVTREVREDPLELLDQRNAERPGVDVQAKRSGVPRCPRSGDLIL